MSDGNNFLSLFYAEPLICRCDTRNKHFFYSLLTIHYSPLTTMNELIQRLTSEAGLTPEQAQKAVATIAGFVKEKFPMLGGAVDQIFAAGAKEEE